MWPCGAGGGLGSLVMFQRRTPGLWQVTLWPVDCCGARAGKQNLETLTGLWKWHDDHALEADAVETGLGAGKRQS